MTSYTKPMLKFIDRRRYSRKVIEKPVKIVERKLKSYFQRSDKNSL